MVGGVLGSPATDPGLGRVGMQCCDRIVGVLHVMLRALDDVSATGAATYIKGPGGSVMDPWRTWERGLCSGAIGLLVYWYMMLGSSWSSLRYRPAAAPGGHWRLPNRWG